MSVRTIVLVSIVAVLLIALTVVTGLRSGDATPTPDSGPVSADRPVLLMQVTGPDGYATGNAVLTATLVANTPAMSTPPAPSGAVAFIPASLLVAVSPDDSTQVVTLGRTPLLPDTLDAVRGVRATLDIRVDAGLTVDRLALAGLVDAVDGVVVDVPEAILVPVDDTVVSVPAGRVRMGGLLAADYATLRSAGDTDASRTARFAAVLLAILPRLPDEPERMRQVLTSLGFLAVSTVPTDDLIGPLVALGDAARADALTVSEVPTRIVRDGARPASVLAPDASEALVEFPPADQSAPADMAG